MQGYHVIEQNYVEPSPPEDYFTIQDLMNLALLHEGKEFEFKDTYFTVGKLHSWRGSYDLPAISYEEEVNKTGEQIYKELKKDLEKVHHGYKGGEYTYSRDDIFYVSRKGCADDYKVFKWKEEDGVIVLYTYIDPYR